MKSNRHINPSGFPENLPSEQIVEDSLKSTIKNVAELYGYCHLETTSVEYMDTLSSTGDVSKEIYTIGRAKAEGEGESESAQRGLHFDLTVPFARYVAQNQGDLWFPYRRYQIQKVWRGERPQKGRFREFYQADVDVVARENLAIAFDAEIALVMATILDSFGIGPVTMHINNRKFLNGIFKSLNIEDINETLQIIDKLDKIGEQEVRKLLYEKVKIETSVADELFKIISKKIKSEEVVHFMESISSSNTVLDEGKTEVCEIFKILVNCKSFSNVSFVFNPRIARGLDYYTGTVYETTVDGLEHYGSICSGGRYADLASRFTNQKLPGVGMSIGLTRLITILKEEKLKEFVTKTKNDIAICLINEERLLPSLITSEELRKHKVNVEVNYKHTTSLGKQLEQFKERDIPFALVCENDNTFTLFELKLGVKQIFITKENFIEYLLSSLQKRQSQI